MKRAAAVQPGGPRRWRIAGAAVFVLLAIALAASIATFDWNRLKGTIESRVTDATGQAVFH